jgi:hypothetical protein
MALDQRETPRHIYASTLQRRDRSWGRRRTTVRALAARGMLVSATSVLAVLAATRLPL